MKNTVFTGAATALITPFTATGVDYEAMGRLIDFQLVFPVFILVGKRCPGIAGIKSRSGR